jgi:recombination protein RecT
VKSLQKTTYLTVRDMLKENKGALRESLAKIMDVEAFSRIALGELRTNPALLDCDPKSLMSSIGKAAELGLVVGSAMGGAYLVPYKANAQLIIGYRGLIALARRSGEILSLTAHVVHEKDVFELELGLEEKLRHIPTTEQDPGPMVCAYAVAKLNGGGLQFEVMSRSQIDAIRARSRASSNGPWVTDYEEMARKTVVRRLAKYLPMAIQMADALAADQDVPAEEINVTGMSDLAENLNATARDAAKSRPEQAEPPVREDRPVRERVVSEQRPVREERPAPTERPTQEARPEEGPEWPKVNADGEMYDKNGVKFSSTFHSSSKRCNADGTWRMVRGFDPELYRRWLEGEKLAAQQKTPERPQETATSEPEPEAADPGPSASGGHLSPNEIYDQIQAAKNLDDLDLSEDLFGSLRASYDAEWIEDIEALIKSRRADFAGADEGEF